MLAGNDCGPDRAGQARQRNSSRRTGPRTTRIAVALTWFVALGPAPSPAQAAGGFAAVSSPELASAGSRLDSALDAIVGASCLSSGPIPSEPVWIAAQDRLIVQTAVCRGEEEERGPRLVILDVRTGHRSDLARGRDATVSPDGAWVAYLSDLVAGSSLRLRSLSSGSERVLAHFERRPSVDYNFSMAWSQGGEALAFAYKADKSQNPNRTTIVVGEADQSATSEIVVHSLSNNVDQKRLSYPGLIAGVDWTADGGALIVSSFSLGYGHPDAEPRADIEIVNVSDGARERVFGGSGSAQWILRAAMSPDRLTFAVNEYPRSFWPTEPHVVLRALRGEVIGRYPGANATWATSGTEVYVTRREKVYDAIYAIDRTGSSRRISRANTSAGKTSVRADGKMVAWVEYNALGDRSVVVRERDANKAVEFDFSPAKPQVDRPLVEERCWMSRDDARLCGLLLLPSSSERRSFLPLVVDVHGGPTGGVQMSGSLLLWSPLEWQIWTELGYAVFVPDYRASGWSGMAPIERSRRRGTLFPDCASDIMLGVDDLIRSGIVDGDRMAIVGHSFGATVVNYLIGTTDRFKAAVSKEGFADAYHSSTFSSSVTSWLFEGPPWMKKRRYLKNSATLQVDRITTPTLFLAGEKSGVPLYNSKFMHAALNDRQVETGMIIYRGEGHAFSSHAALDDVFRRSVSWVIDHTQPQ